ncbi:AAA domain protein [Leptospira broomii serovar Hurstbridge str. 5399]|uniref:AAA domain protein n=1 Tax=Leptospira broomii serovar Hurstbridge str. 5399 TaxID=1049789 RepID=T0GCY5_9LEPT|nr:AAA family ATPase [Leptospira broomii]EQA44659.1 AAA domain protein [Leptospira broomii serovar Hurstbridge str. 5399]TGM09682.1 hypothetical protein EHQ86_00275 [Leptospira yasudae]
MRYLGFNIRNFKGIREVSIDLNKKPYINIFTLIGLNESGKTTILEAIHYFSILETKDDHKYIPKSKKHNYNESITVEAILELSEEDKLDFRGFLKQNFNFKLISDSIVFTVEKRQSFKNSALSESTRSWRGSFRVLYGKNNKERDVEISDESFKAIQDYLEKLRPVIVYFPNFLFDVPEKIYLQELPDTPEKAPQKEQTKEALTLPFFLRAVQDVLDYMDEGLTIFNHIIESFNARENSKADKEAIVFCVYMDFSI